MFANQMVKMQTLDLEGNRIGEEGLHALTERFQKEHKRSLWNPKQLTSMIDLVILKNNHISPALAASTEVQSFATSMYTSISVIHSPI